MSDSLVEDRITNGIWQIWKAWRKLSHPVRQGKITPEQFWVLHILNREDSLRIKDIAGIIGTNSSSATTAVKRLDRDGLVLRRRSSEDERVVIVQLTDLGRDIFRNWKTERRKALSRIFAVLDDREKDQLSGLLEKVVRHMDMCRENGEC